MCSKYRPQVRLWIYSVKISQLVSFQKCPSKTLNRRCWHLGQEKRIFLAKTDWLKIFKNKEILIAFLWHNIIKQKMMLNQIKIQTIYKCALKLIRYLNRQALLRVKLDCSVKNRRFHFQTNPINLISALRISTLRTCLLFHIRAIEGFMLLWQKNSLLFIFS